jgi:hypothetical protein
MAAQWERRAGLATVLLHNPQAPLPQASASLTALPHLRESRAGVLANTKQHADLLLNAIVDEMGKTYGVIKELNGLRPATSRGDPAQIEQFAQACDWVITGSAD